MADETGSTNTFSAALKDRNTMLQAGAFLAEGFRNAGFGRAATGAAGSRPQRSPEQVQERLMDVNENLTSLSKKEVALRKAALSQYNKQTKLFNNLNDYIGQLNPRAREFRREISRAGDMITKRFEEISDRFGSVQEQELFWSQMRSKQGKTLFDLEERRSRILKRLNNLDENSGYARAHFQKELMEVEKDRLTLMNRANTSLRVNANTTAALTATFTALKIATDRLVDDFTSQLRFGMEQAGTFSGLINQQLQGITTGVDPKALAEMSAQARIATNALGGQAEMNRAVTQLQLRNFRITGDLTDAARHTQEMMQLLAETGIRPSIQRFEEQTATFERMQRMTGMTADQLRAMTKEMSMDDGIRAVLRSASMQEREQIMQTLQVRQAERIALGLTQEEAMNAAKALGRIAGEGPRERFRRAARVQMMGAALGIEGAAEAAQAIRRGDLQNPAVEAFMRQTQTQREEARALSRQGAFGREFMLEGIMQRTEMADIVENFSTALVEGRQSQIELDNKRNESLTQAVKILQQIQGALGGTVAGPAAGLLGAGTAFAGGLIAQRILGGPMGRAGRGLLERFTTRRSPAQSSFAKKISGWQGNNQNMKPKSGAGGKPGLFGKMKGGLGAAARFGGRFGARAALGAIPGIGTVLTVGMLGYEAYKTISNLSQSQETTADTARISRTVEDNSNQMIQTMDRTASASENTTSLLQEIRDLNRTSLEYQSGILRRNDISGRLSMIEQTSMRTPLYGS